MGCVGALGLPKGSSIMTFMFFFFRVIWYCSSCVILRLQVYESRELMISFFFLL